MWCEILIDSVAGKCCSSIKVSAVIAQANNTYRLIETTAALPGAWQHSN